MTAMKRYRRCRYRNEECYIIHQLPNGDFIIATNSEGFVRADSGWKGVDKFEWEKTVPATDVTMLPDENQGDGT